MMKTNMSNGDNDDDVYKDNGRTSIGDIVTMLMVMILDGTLVMRIMI